MITRALTSWHAIAGLILSLLASIIGATLWASDIASDGEHTAEAVRAHAATLAEQDDALGQLRVDVAEIRVEQRTQGEQLDRIEAAVKVRR